MKLVHLLNPNLRLSTVVVKCVAVCELCQSPKVIISILFIAAGEVKEYSKVRKRPVGGHGNTGGSNQDTKQAEDMRT